MYVPQKCACPGCRVPVSVARASVEEDFVRNERCAASGSEGPRYGEFLPSVKSATCEQVSFVSATVPASSGEPFAVCVRLQGGVRLRPPMPRHDHPSSRHVICVKCSKVPSAVDGYPGTYRDTSVCKSVCGPGVVCVVNRVGDAAKVWFAAVASRAFRGECPCARVNVHVYSRTVTAVLDWDVVSRNNCVYRVDDPSRAVVRIHACAPEQ